MIKWFLIYALVAALITCPWFTIVCYEEADKDIERVAKESKVGKRTVLIALYAILILLGWLWLPYKLVAVCSRKIKKGRA